MSEILSANRLTDALAEIEKFVLASDEAGLGAASRSWALPGFLKGEMKRIACDLIRFAPDAHREGRFLAFSGVDKTGKGTHLFNISNKAGVVSVISHLREKGFHTLGITQPSYGSLMGGLVAAHLGKRDTRFRIYGQIPSGYAWLLWSLDRAQHNDRILSWLRRGKMNVVVTKRWTDSNVVYQAANGVDPKRVLDFESRVIRPDAVLVLEAPLRVVLDRLRSPDAYENTPLLEKVISLYGKLEELYPLAPVFRLDASSDPHTVNAKILDRVDRILGISPAGSNE